MKIELTKEAAKEMKRLLYVSAMNECSKMNSTGLSNVLYLVKLVEDAEAEEQNQSEDTSEEAQ